MGLQNLKLEVEAFSFQQPPFNIGGLGGISPIKTEADPTILSQLATQVASQLGQLTLAVGQLQAAVGGQAFTRAAPQVGAEGASLVEEVRKLSQRIDELEARPGKG